MKEFKLENEPKITSGFSIPGGYFDTFPNKIFNPLPKNESKILSVFSLKKQWYLAAAAIVVLMLSIPLYNDYNLVQDEVDSATLENYLAYQANISEEDIVNLLDENELKKINLDLKIRDKDIEEILNSNINLEQYILD